MYERELSERELQKEKIQAAKQALDYSSAAIQAAQAAQAQPTAGFMKAVNPCGARTVLLAQLRETEEQYIRGLAAIQGLKDEINCGSDFELEQILKFQRLYEKFPR